MLSEILRIVFPTYSTDNQQFSIGSRASPIDTKPCQQNHLVTASCYAFQLLTIRDFAIWNLVAALVTDLDPSRNKELVYILVAWYCTYVSTNTVYHLPMLLDTQMVNSKPTVHVVFGENVAQLVSISLMAEGYRVLGELSKQLDGTVNHQRDVGITLRVAYQEYHKIQAQSKILESLENLSTEVIQEDYLLIKVKLYLSLLATTFGLVGWEEAAVESIRPELVDIAESLTYERPIRSETVDRLSEAMGRTSERSLFLSRLLQKKSSS